MSSNEKRGGALSNKDLANVFRRAIHLNGMNDYPGQMHSGYTNAMIPALKKRSIRMTTRSSSMLTSVI